MKELTLELALVKSTKGTHVYGDDKEGAAIPSVYIKKAALPSPAPEKLRVVITAEG